MTSVVNPPATPIALAEGDEMPVGTAGPMTRTDFVRYAGASGDFHPMHHDDEMAHASGLPSVFGMGLLHAGILGDHLARWVGPNNLLSFGIRCTATVWPGDVLTVAGSVARIEEIDGGRRAHLTLTVRRQTGELAIMGSAVAISAAAQARHR